MTKRCTQVTAVVLLLSLLGAVAAQVAQARHRKHHGGTLPYMGAQPAPSLFGIDTGLYDSVFAHYVRDFGTARALGARWDHFVLGPPTGGGNFRTIDDEVTRARKQRMGVILSFGGIPQACSRHALLAPAVVHRCPPTTGGDFRRYEAYTRKVLLRYRNNVTYYESWIEINHDTADMTARQYAALLKAQYAVFQSVNRNYHLQLKLLYGSEIGFSVGGHSHWTAVLPFANEVLDDLHGAKPFDGIALHAYRFPPQREGPLTRDCDWIGGLHVSQGHSTPDCPAPNWRLMTWQEELTAYEQEFESHGYGQQPLWLTEFGWPGGGPANCYPQRGYCPDEQTQDTYLKQAYRVLLSLPFVQGALWFNLRDYQPGVTSPDPAFFYFYGLLGYNYTPKPAAADFTAIARANPGR